MKQATVFLPLFFTASTLVLFGLAPTASASSDDALGAATHSRNILEDHTPEEWENLRNVDKAAWENADHGSGKRRALRQSSGNAVGKRFSTSTPTQSSSKILANGRNCLIISNSKGTANCQSNVIYVVPGCCTSSSETSSTVCATWDSGEDIICSAASRPYPACCEFRDQPAAACNVYSSSTSVTCGTAKPGVACCSGGTCSLNSDGSGGTCKASTSLGCCPA